MKTLSTKKARAKKAPVHLGRPKRTKAAASKPIPKSFYEEFKQFFGILKDGPPDFAENHKLYASGAKKWDWK